MNVAVRRRKDVNLRVSFGVRFAAVKLFAGIKEPTEKEKTNEVLVSCINNAICLLVLGVRQ